METRAKCTKVGGSCNVSSSKTEHMAKLRSEEKYGSPETELYSYKACCLYLCYVFCIQLLLPYGLGKNANESMQQYLQFWPRLSPRDWIYPPTGNSLKTRLPRHWASDMKDNDP